MKTGCVAVICATLLVIGFAFWPTIYRYDRLGGRGGISVPIRINRLTGRAEEYPWGDAGPPGARAAPSTTETEALPDAERAKITGNAGFGDGFLRGLFSGKLYNGSDWTVERVTFRVVAKEVGGKVRWDRSFAEKVSIAPLTTRDFRVQVTGEENAGSCEWYVVDAYGRKP